MNYYLLISLCLAAVSSLFSLIRQFQMLQQNSYYPSRYLGWLKENLPFFNVALFFIASVLFIIEQFLPLSVFCAAVLTIRIPKHLNLQKKSIKKLVLTARVKRLFATAIIIQVILISVYVIKPVSLAGSLCLDFSFVFSYLVPIYTFVIWGVTLPIEKAFNLYFVNDAKKILRSYKDLKVIGITGSYG